jgi:hypothetical protein
MEFEMEVEGMAQMPYSLTPASIFDCCGRARISHHLLPSLTPGRFGNRRSGAQGICLSR